MKLIKEINGFCIWEITNADDLHRMSKGTHLCTQIYQIAEAYSRDTPLYMVTMPREDGYHMRVCLIHQETKQVKNMNNSDIDEFVEHILIENGIAKYLHKIKVFDTPKRPFLTGEFNNKKWDRRYRKAMIEAGLIKRFEKITERELYEEIEGKIEESLEKTPTKERKFTVK